MTTLQHFGYVEKKKTVCWTLFLNLFLDSATFWKPEQLSNMTEIEQAFRELTIWQGLREQKKINSTVIKSVNSYLKLEAFEKQLGPYIEACILADMVRMITNIYTL